ncbi:MAG TPA: divalent metal cation transporter [Gemmatimonadaceae bacterium]|nr:divalent metal cation transporter [Gemmatimonadaceae bacterium]
MKKIFDVALGIVTGIGGFLEVGSITTAAQAGASFGYRLAWAVAIGAFGLIVLSEMSGRLAAVSGRTLADAMRERFGFRFFVIPLVVVLLVSFLVLASELGGVALALQMATNVSLRWWVLIVTVVAWALLWKGTFSIIEYGTAGLGLVALAFVVAAVKLHPHWGQVAGGLVPTQPADDRAHYWFLAVSILGASISPYLYFFYSSGSIEDEWDVTYLKMNRVVAGLGNALGGLLALAVLVVAARVFLPRGIEVERGEQLAMLLSSPLARWGFAFFIMALGVNCFGAATEIALSCAYLIAQGLGWEWGEDAHPKRHARYSLAYTVLLFLAAVPMAAGVDPLKLTNVSMALTAASLPVTVIPMIVLMNDEALLHEHTNKWAGNAALAVLALLSVVLLVAALPLQLMGGG